MLRIENRALPAGPTIIDQIANAALFYGLMHYYQTDAKSIPQRIAFEDAKVNFFAAAQHGLDARFTWLDGYRLGVRELLRKELIPAADAAGCSQHALLCASLDAPSAQGRCFALPQ